MVPQVSQYLPEFFLFLLIVAYTILTALDLFKAFRAQRLQAVLAAEGAVHARKGNGDGEDDDDDPLGDSNTKRWAPYRTAARLSRQQCTRCARKGVKRPGRWVSAQCLWCAVPHTPAWQ